MRILAVDDDEISLDLLEHVLDAAGYEVIAAQNGSEALARVKAGDVRIVVTDWSMPEMDGLALCRAIRELPLEGYVYILMMTSFQGTQRPVEGLAAGADDFLSKPFDPAELVVRVRAGERILDLEGSLRSAVRMRDDLATMIVHDLRNPVQNIALHTEYLAEEPNLSDAGRERLRKIEAETQRLAAFANDLLFSAKMESGRLVLNQSREQLEAFLRTSVDHHEELARSRRVRLEYDPTGSEGVEIDVDRALFQRAIDNVVDNAIKFSPPDQRVIVRTGRADEGSSGVRIEIADQGPGIPEPLREAIFDKFEIASLKRQGVNQVGLGLAFTRMVVDAHGGKVKCEANCPSGSNFIIELPVAA